MTRSTQLFLILAFAILCNFNMLSPASAIQSTDAQKQDSKDKKPAAKKQNKNKKKAKPKRRVNPAMAVVKDDPKLPRVMLIGDSISIGYTVAVRELLKGKANVHRPLTNCGPTTKGVKEIEKWLGDKKWDVIHFNFGLHDLKYMGPKGQNLADPKLPTSKPQVSIEDYEKNLESIVGTLKETKAKLIWRSTTPVPVGCKGRVVGDSKKYNEVALSVMKKHGIEVDDMYEYALEAASKIQRKADVHYTLKGSKFLAEKVVEHVSKHLKK